MIRRLILFLSMALLSGCAIPDWKIDGRITRYVTLDHNKFEPATIRVPANTPFTLAIDAYSYKDEVFFVSKDLGISERYINAATRFRRTSYVDIPVRTRIPVQGLQAGRYSIYTQQDGAIAVGTVKVVTRTNVH